MNYTIVTLCCLCVALHRYLVFTESTHPYSSRRGQFWTVGLLLATQQWWQVTKQPTFTTAHLIHPQVESSGTFTLLTFFLPLTTPLQFIGKYYTLYATTLLLLFHRFCKKKNKIKNNVILQQQSSQATQACNKLHQFTRFNIKMLNKLVHLSRAVEVYIILK